MESNILSRSSILDIIRTKGKGAFNHIKFKYESTYSFINTQYTGKNFGERTYRYIYEDTLMDKCTICNNISKFLNINTGYSKYCGKRCYSTVHGQVIKQLIIDGKYDPSKRKSSKDTFLSNGGSYTNNTVKRQNTLLVRYGVSNPSQMESHRDKVISNNIKKYGTVKNKKKSDILKVRIRNNEIGINSNKYKLFLNKNNITNISQRIDIKNKILETRRIRCYNSLFTSRLNNLLEPLFTLDEFILRKYDYSFKCKKCNTVFIGSIQNGNIPRCITCNPLYQIRSIQQNILNDYIQLLGYKTIQNARSVIPGIELDIYIPAINTAIEYNGLYWHSELAGKKDKNYHIDKLHKCINNNIRLIHIFEDEWINKQDIVKMKLSNILGVNTLETIYARNCNIMEISSIDSNLFLDRNHIQGKDNSGIRIGLFYKSELISVMTFSNLRLPLGSTVVNGKYELVRFCSNKHIPGAAGKLLSYFIKKYSPVSIISYADRRWSIGNLYEKLGFIRVSYTAPNYWYMSNYTTRLYRYGFAKHMLSTKLTMYDKSITEWANMQLNGYDRIWDCGNIKYEMLISNNQ